MSAERKASRWPWIARRCVQVSVLLFMVYTSLGGAWRNYKLSHNQARLVALLEGEAWGTLYQLNEDALGLFGDPYEASFGLIGFPWAGTIAGLPVADPIMVLSQVVQGGGVPLGLLLSSCVALGVALVLGKVFCSHLCPMRFLFEVGQGFRKGLLWLGVPLPEVRPTPRLGAWVLAGGLAGAALSSTALWLLILPYAGLGAGLFLLISAGTVSAVLLVALAWVVVDMLIAPGFFCHNLCPTGFLLEQVGRSSVVRLRRRRQPPCPDKCRQCILACPYHLSPKTDAQDPACDICGACVLACPQKRLARGLRVPGRAASSLTLALALLCCFGTTPLWAHHNKGLPHYGYFENYPQVPVDEYVEIHGAYEVGATVFNFQGLDRREADTPNDVKIYLYIYDLDQEKSYEGPVDFEIRRGEQVVSTFRREKVDEEKVYSTRETLPASDTYTLVGRLHDPERSVVTLSFYVDLAADRVDWLLVAGMVVPVILLFGLALSRRRLKPHRPRSARRPEVVAASLLLLLAANAGAWAAQGVALERGAAPGGAVTLERSHTKHHESMNHGSMHHPDGAGAAAAHGGAMKHLMTEDGQMVMVMPGLPRWLFLTGIAALLIVSFVVVEVLRPEPRQGRRINLIKNRKIYLMVRSRWFQAVPQALSVTVLLFLIYAGFVGSSVHNITPVAVWTIWWALLIVVVFLMGPLFCFACPWDGLANLVTRLGLRKRIEPLNLDAPLPTWLQNLYPAILLFALLTWLELGFGITTSPRGTAMMGLGMGVLAVAAALIWPKKAFCHRFCPVGRISGIYSNCSPVEIRARKARTCQVCTTEDCLHGNERGYPCPTGISLKSVSDSTYCIGCMECVKSCNKFNVALNLRPFGAGLHQISTGRLDEALLAITLLTLTLFHGLTMTPAWETFQPGGSSLLKWMALTFGTSRLVNFSVAMLLLCTLPVALYWVVSLLGARWAGDPRVGPGRLFLDQAWSLLPIALFYHLAHNAMHIFMEGGSIVPLLSDPLGRGWDLFGTASMHVGPLLSDGTVWILQVGLILVGHVMGIVVAHRIAHRLYGDPRAATRSLVPMLVMMIALSVVGLGLMHLDMNMRVGRM